MYFQCNIQSSLYWTVHCFYSQLWKVFWVFWRGLVSDPSCFVLLKAERALHFFTRLSLWFSTSVQSAKGGATSSLYKSYTCPSGLGMYHGPGFGKHGVSGRTVWTQNAGCASRRQRHAQNSCLKEQCKTLKWVLRNTCPLEHLVIQLCRDSHHCYSFFSKLPVGSLAGW